jgi:hypothetical protein
MTAPRCIECGESDWSEAGTCRSCSVFPTLGYQVAELIEATCVIPDGDHVGEPYELTDEMLRYLLGRYRVHPATGRFFYPRGSQLVRPQKWGKGPLTSSIIIAECHPDGPVRPAGWDASGQPVGRPWPTPWYQVTATSESQTDNVWRALVPMIELGDLAADIPDTGETRINLPGGGKIEPVTSSAQARLGQRITGASQDETHSWTAHNGGRKLADTQRRNLAGTGGRFEETTNKWDPADESVAEQTSREDGVYHDDVDPGKGSIRNKADRRRMLKKVYGDSWWVDLDRIDDEITELVKRDPSQAERYFLNRESAGAGQAFDPDRWKQLAKPGLLAEPEAKGRRKIVIGVDGARFVDALGAIATDIETGHQWPVGIWERPEGAPPEYEHPFADIDGAMLDAFERFTVWRVYVDPQYIEHLLQKWQGRWGEKRVIPWWMHRKREVAWAVRNYTEAQGAGDMSHDGDEKFAEHMRNARKRKLDIFDDKHRQMHTIGKDRPDSPRKMDAAAAGVISWEARGDAIAADALNEDTDGPAFDPDDYRMSVL